MGWTQSANDTHTIALWHFDEGDGDTLYDDSGNGHNGYINGASWETDGVFGSCLAFDGKDDYVEVPTAKDLIPSDRMSLELWVKIAAFPSVHFALISKADNYHGGSGYLWGIENTGKPKSYFILIDWKFSNTVMPVDRWVYLAITIDQKKLKYYMNGYETDNFNVKAGSLNNNEFNLIIGRTENTNTYFLNGRLDEIRISNVTRSAEEIEQNWKNYSAHKVMAGNFSFKNGDKLSGEIIKPPVIDFETDYGRMSIPIADIRRIDFGGKKRPDMIQTESSKISGRVTADVFLIRCSFGEINAPKEQILKIEY
jgi:hypothetical protein